MKFFKIIFCALLLNQLTACGIEESASNLKSPSVQVYTFNNTGENGATGKFSTSVEPCPELNIACQVVVPKGDAAALVSFKPHPGAFIIGPYLTFQPGPQGIGHISAEVELQPVDGTSDGETRVVVDLVSRGPNGLATMVHDTQVINLRQNSGKILVSLTAKAFHEPLVDVEVRVRDISYTAIDFFANHYAPFLQVNYTRIIYN